MPRLTTTAADLVARARARIDEVTTEDLVARHGDPDLVIADIRDIRERQRTGWIPGSVHAPRGMLEFWIDPESPHFKEVFGQEGKTCVLHCASGWRPALSGAAPYRAGAGDQGPGAGRIRPQQGAGAAGQSKLKAGSFPKAVFSASLQPVETIW